MGLFDNLPVFKAVSLCPLFLCVDLGFIRLLTNK